METSIRPGEATGTSLVGRAPKSVQPTDRSTGVVGDGHVVDVTGRLIARTGHEQHRDAWGVVVRQASPSAAASLRTGATFAASGARPEKPAPATSDSRRTRASSASASATDR